MQIEMYNYKIEHRSSERMKHVDALSRRDAVMPIRDHLAGRLERAQARDEKLIAIKALLDDSKPFKDYSLDGGLIFKGSGADKNLLFLAE